ncbi:unnamed protein product [Amoebophrya sp. A25]|nr:unnamed protein product [Amoebophrya sp. A25]|eukprot:GSA25T00018619001.1
MRRCPVVLLAVLVVVEGVVLLLLWTSKRTSLDKISSWQTSLMKHVPLLHRQSQLRSQRYLLLQRLFLLLVLVAVAHLLLRYLMQLLLNCKCLQWLPICLVRRQNHQQRGHQRLLPHQLLWCQRLPQHLQRVATSSGTTLAKSGSLQTCLNPFAKEFVPGGVASSFATDVNEFRPARYEFAGLSNRSELYCFS